MRRQFGGWRDNGKNRWYMKGRNVRQPGRGFIHNGRGKMRRRETCQWSVILQKQKHSWQIWKFIKKIVNSDFAFWFNVMYPKSMHKNRPCNADFSSQNTCELSAGKQKHHFTAYWSCQHWQGEKCCLGFCHSCSRFGAGNSTDNSVCSIRSENHTNTHIQASHICLKK